MQNGREKSKAFLIIFLQIYFSFSNSSHILILRFISFSSCLLEKKEIRTRSRRLVPFNLFINFVLAAWHVGSYFPD